MGFNYAEIREKHGAQLAARAWYSKARAEAGFDVTQNHADFMRLAWQMYEGPGKPDAKDPLAAFDPLLMNRLYPSFKERAGPLDWFVKRLKGTSRDWPVFLRALPPANIASLHALLDEQSARDAIDDPESDVWGGGEHAKEVHASWKAFDESLNEADTVAIFVLLKNRFPVPRLLNDAEKSLQGEREVFEDHIARLLLDMLDVPTMKE